MTHYDTATLLQPAMHTCGRPTSARCVFGFWISRYSVSARAASSLVPPLFPEILLLTIPMHGKMGRRGVFLCAAKENTTLPM